MHIQKQRRKNTKGQYVNYVQIAESKWDPVRGRPASKVLFNLGREEKLAEVAPRLIASLQKIINDNNPQQDRDVTSEENLVLQGEITSSLQVGIPYVLDTIWQQFGLDKIIKSTAEQSKASTGRPKDIDLLERTIFALVASRAITPESKLAATRLINQQVHIKNLDTSISEDHAYRAMDWMWDNYDQLVDKITCNIIEVTDAEVDLVLFDTSNIYFEIDREDTPVLRNSDGTVYPDQEIDPAFAPDGCYSKGMRHRGKSKEKRDDLPQVTVGMATTKQGIPLRVWAWPGATADTPLIRQVRDELKTLGVVKVVYAADRGFASKENRDYLSRATDNYIIGVKGRRLSLDDPVAKALSAPGKYTTTEKENLKVKEVKLSEQDNPEQDRIIICYNPEQAQRDADKRDEFVAMLQAQIDGSDAKDDKARAVLEGQIKAKPYLYRYLRVTKKGLLRVSQQKIRQDARLDGIYIIRTSCPESTMSAQKVAVTYKNLLAVERGWRTLKSQLQLRPVYHQKEHRIRMHIVLCWLSLLLVRVAEIKTGIGWQMLREVLRGYQVSVLDAGNNRQALLYHRPADEVVEIFGTVGAELPSKPSKINLVIEKRIDE